MKRWILASSLFSASVLGCDFNSSVKDVYSLSGVVTTAFKEMGLLKSPKLKGLSVFYPLSQNDFQGAIIPGGIFLSPKLSANLKSGLVFFDESQELRKVLPSAVEVKTRGLTPSEVTSEVIRLLGPYLSGCEDKKSELTKKTKDKTDELLKLASSKPAMIFFLGSYERQRLPETVIAHDGVVKFLKEQKSFVSYPSELAYVPWSVKILETLPKSTLKITIKDSGRSLEKRVVTYSPEIRGLIYPGALIPGIDQVEAWIYLLKNL